MTDSPNAPQIAHWNDSSGRTWAELHPLLERQLAKVRRRSLETLAPRPGERILDVGCGCGGSTLALAELVGAAGQAIGVDVSRPMLEIARARADAAPNASAARFVEGDAQTYPFEPASFDALFSSFGVMFFTDPRAAFTAVGAALKPGARVVFACWRAAAENPVMTRAMAAAAHRFPPPVAPVPGAPGPFAFADAAHVRAVLEGAGFVDVALAPDDEDMGGNDLEDTVTLSVRLGPLGAALRERPELADAARADVRAALLPFVVDGIVWQASATWIVTARRR